MKDAFDENAARKAWMGLLAKAPQGQIGTLLDRAMTRPSFKWLRAPEIGSTMVRARAGGTGAPFNLGEMTITRCALTLETGEVGHAYIQGRSKPDAEAAALVDALMQTAAAAQLQSGVLDPLRTQMEQARADRAAKAAATKVDFFTMMRGGGLMQTNVLTGGFANPALEASTAFRNVMEAMARPGTFHNIAGATPPAPLSPAAGAVLLTLCDTETPVHLAGDADCEAVRQWLAFHTGAPLTGPSHCMFALGTWQALGPLSAYRIGTWDYPDRSATLIVECDALHAEGAVLTGPGIQEVASLSLSDVPAFQNNNALFPMGLDFIFTCGDRLAALPRSTKIDVPASTKEVR